MEVTGVVYCIVAYMRDISIDVLPFFTGILIKNSIKAGDRHLFYVNTFLRYDVSPLWLYPLKSTCYLWCADARDEADCSTGL